MATHGHVWDLTGRRDELEGTAPNLPVGVWALNGNWRFTIATVSGTMVTDPISGLPVMAPISWTLRVTCTDAAGAATQTYQDATFNSTQGRAFRTQVSALDASDAAVTVAPAENCPLPAKQVTVYAGSADLTDDQSSPTASASSPTSGGGWSAVTLTLPRHPGGTQFFVGVQCDTDLSPDSVNCYYTLAQAQLPDG